MKKNIIKVTLVAVFALIAGYNVYASQKAETLSDLALANVEALAESREYHVNPDCANGCVSGSQGCYCFEPYPNYSEAKWH